MRLALISLVMIPLTIGCDKKKPVCSNGTHLEDDACVADVESDTHGDTEADTEADADADADPDGE